MDCGGRLVAGFIDRPCDCADDDDEDDDANVVATAGAVGWFFGGCCCGGWFFGGGRGGGVAIIAMGCRFTHTRSALLLGITSASTSVPVRRRTTASHATMWSWV
jgi:hypothetical protein